MQTKTMIDLAYIADVLRDYAGLQTGGLVGPANRYPPADVIEQAEALEAVEDVDDREAFADSLVRVFDLPGAGTVVVLNLLHSVKLYFRPSVTDYGVVEVFIAHRESDPDPVRKLFDCVNADMLQELCASMERDLSNVSGDKPH